MTQILTAILIALITWYVATMMPMFLRWSCYMGGPLVGGLVCGIIFGNIPYGLQVGATIQLAYLGAIAVGGTLPSELAIAGYLGTALTMSAGLEASAGLSIAVMLGSLGLLCRNAYMSLNSLVVQRADKYAEEGNAKKVRLMNQWGSQIVPFITYFIPSFLAMYFGADALQALMNVIPAKFITALSVSGGLIPALGIALLLIYVWDKKFIPYFVLGFFLVAYLNLNTMFIAIIGGCVAVIYMFANQKEGASAAAAEPEQDAKNLAETKLLTKKDLTTTWLRWICWAQRCYNYERLMGLGFCQAIANVIVKLFPGKEERAEALTRHMAFYNTENNWGAMILGATCAMEEDRAMGKPVEPEMIDSMKSALMGPLAGIGDSITQSIVKVILLGICIEMAAAGNLLGPMLFIVGFTAYCLIVSYFTFFSGYKMGRSAVTMLLSSDIARSITGALKIVSMMVIGAMAAANIRANVIVSGNFGGSTVVLQDVLNSILPKMLPLAVLLFCTWLLKKKQKSSIFVLLVLFAIGFALTFLNILG